MKKHLIPLVLVEGYLIFTIVVFLFGPVRFNYKNEFAFIVLLILYHLSFVAGYIQAFQSKSTIYGVKNKVFSRKKFWLIFFLGLVSVIASYNNVMISNTLLPYDLFENINRGINEPGLVYAERMLNIEQGQNSGSRLFNIFSILFSFAKLLFIFYSIFFWVYMNFIHKTIFILYSVLFVSVGISAGVNSVIFIFAIFSLCSWIIIMYMNKNKYFKISIYVSSLIILIPILSFGNIMSQRGGGFDYFVSASPLGDVSLSSYLKLDDATNFFDFLNYSFVWLSYYVVQGYYGFSLIIDIDWSWTFGFGNSEFLQRQFELITGYDISKLTYQHKIDHYWDKSAHWHSFYSQFANDFGIYGLVVLMFGLGYHFSRIVHSATIQNSFYAAALIPMFVIMFIFFPANNQVFAYIDMISYFIIVNILWFLEGKKIKA